MRAQMVVTFVVISLLKINTSEGKNMTTKAFSTCLKETYKSMSNSITCSAGYCQSLLNGRTSPSHIFNTNCRNQCPGCFKAILRMLTYKEKQMAATTTSKILAVTNAPITKPIIKATTMQLVTEATTNQQVADLNTPAYQAGGTDFISTSTWDLGITALIVVKAVLAIVATVLIFIFRRDLVARCKLSRSSKNHASRKLSYTPVDSQTGEDMGRVEEPKSSDNLLQEMPNDRPHSSVTNSEVQRVANDPPPQTMSNGMDSLTTPKSMALQASTLAIASPMMANGTTPHQPNGTTQVFDRVSPSEILPTAANGAVPRTAPNRTPNGAVPQTAPNGAVPKTAPNGAVPQTAPNGAPPLTAPNGASPHTRSGPPQAGQCRGVPQAGPTGALPKAGPSSAPPQIATNGNNVHQTVGTGGGLHNITANKITIYNFNNPDSHQHHVNYRALAQPNTESPVQQNNHHHFSAAQEEEGELTVPDEAGDREGPHKLLFLER